MLGVILRFLLCLSLSLHVLYADIDTQIEAIQNASVEERFKLMNAFKKNLIKMKEKERIKAIHKLTNKSKNKQAKNVLTRLEENIKKEKIRKHLEHQQIDVSHVVSESENYETGEYSD